MKIAANAHRKAGSQRWFPTGSAASLPVIALKRKHAPLPYPPSTHTKPTTCQAIGWAKTTEPPLALIFPADTNPQSP
jgi:hypothetical protein